LEYLDISKKQLIFTYAEPNKIFWDLHWKIGNDTKNKILNTSKTFVSDITKRYLKPEAGVILEGGCGNGIHVASLVNNGYKCVGVDFAEGTVKKINQYIPELDIRIADIRKLPFKNNYFIGYWSIGVIEHFWGGYKKISLEMLRVLKNEGYLFLTFPYMSFLRKFKSKLGFYKLWNGQKPADFYQFILNSKSVIKDFQKIGFKLVKTISFDGIKGAKDEIKFIRPLMKRLYSNNIFISSIRKIINVFITPIAGHVLILVLRKRM